MSYSDYIRLTTFRTGIEYNGRYTKLGKEVDFWNWYRFQSRLKLKIFKARSLALIIKKYTSIINLSPVLIYKIRIPLWFNAYSSTEVGTDYIFSFRKKRVRDVGCSSRGLSRTSTRLFDNNVPTNQLALVKRTFRNKSFRNRAKVVRFNRHNISTSNTENRLGFQIVSRFISPISADKFSNSIK